MEEINLGELNTDEFQKALPKKYIVVDLDCLLDTRLPMACMLDPYGMNKMLMSKSYYKRKKDIFGNIPEIVFKKVYETRTKHLLETARPTLMIEFVREAFSDMAFDVSRLAYSFDVGIFINMYPYYLSMSDLDHFKVLFKNLYNDIEIQFINKSVPELTPEFLRKHAGMLIKYDALYWLEYHTSMLNIFKCHIFGIPIIAPMIGMGSVLKKDLNKEYFKTLRKHHSKVAGLEFLPACMFSFTEEPIDWRKVIETD